MSAKWVTPAWEGPDSPQGPVKVPLPRYTPKFIACCPVCGTDLDDEAFAFWCSSCLQTVPFNQVAIFDEGLPDD